MPLLRSPSPGHAFTRPPSRTKNRERHLRFSLGLQKAVATDEELELLSSLLMSRHKKEPSTELHKMVNGLIGGSDASATTRIFEGQRAWLG